MNEYVVYSPFVHKSNACQINIERNSTRKYTLHRRSTKHNYPSPSLRTESQEPTAEGSWVLFIPKLRSVPPKWKLLRGYVRRPLNGHFRPMCQGSPHVIGSILVWGSVNTPKHLKC